MGFYRGPNIVTDGLVLAVDAGSIRSYPGTGTNLYDLSENNITVELENGAAYNSNNNGNIETDGVDDYISIPGSGDLNFGKDDNFTIETWVNLQSIPSSGSTSGMCCKYRCCGIDWFYPTANTMVFRAGIRNSTNGQKAIFSANYRNLNQWYHLIFTYTSNQSNGMKLYVDGILDAFDTNVNFAEFSNSSQPFNIGSFAVLGGTGTYSNIQSAVTRMYNKALTAAEVTQNFNAQKSRYGL